MSSTTHFLGKGSAPESAFSTGEELMHTLFPAAVGAIMLAGLPFVSAYAAGNAIKIELQDTSTDGAIQNMHMKLEQNSVKAGLVTFQVTNESKAQLHEMMVLKTNLAASALPYD